MQSDPQKSTLANDPKSCYNELCQLPPDKETKDKTMVLVRSEENLLKRLRQLGTGSFQIILIDNEPAILIIGGKVEFLRKFS